MRHIRHGRLGANALPINSRKFFFFRCSNLIKWITFGDRFGRNVNWLTISICTFLINAFIAPSTALVRRNMAGTTNDHTIVDVRCTPCTHRPHMMGLGRFAELMPQGAILSHFPNANATTGAVAGLSHKRIFDCFFCKFLVAPATHCASPGLSIAIRKHSTCTMVYPNGTASHSAAEAPSIRTAARRASIKSMIEA